MTLADYEKDPNHITTAFIKYYYSKLSSDCSKLYQLYTEDAIVKHMESTLDPFKSKFDEHTGVSNIKKYWKSYPFLANAKFVILTLSITQNSDQSLIITIVGEILLREDYEDDLNRKSEILPTRTFNQVFILEPHPIKDNYLIKSDILSFIPDSEYIADETSASNTELINNSTESILKSGNEAQQEVVENISKSLKRTSNSIKESPKSSTPISNSKPNYTSISSTSNAMPQIETQSQLQRQSLSPSTNPSTSTSASASGSGSGSGNGSASLIATPAAAPTLSSTSSVTTMTTTKSKSKSLLPTSPKQSVSPIKIENLPTSASTSAPSTSITSQSSKSKLNSIPATNTSSLSSLNSQPISKFTTLTLAATLSSNSASTSTSQLKPQDSSEITVKPSILTSQSLTASINQTAKQVSTAIESPMLKPAPSNLKPSGSWANALKPAGASTPSTTIVIPSVIASSNTAASARSKSSAPVKSSPQSQSSARLSTENNKYEGTNKNWHNDSALLNSNKCGSLPDALYEVFVIYKNADKEVSESDLSVLFTRNNCYEFKIISMNSRNAVVGFYDEQVQKKFLNKKTLSNNDLTINIDVRNNYANYKKKNYNNGYKKNNNHNNSNNNDRKK